MEKLLRNVLFASRWILAPIYLGLTIALLAICVKFYIEAANLIIHVLHTKEEDLVLGVLSLIDMSLIGGLLVMVMLSGYENFIGKLQEKDQTKLGWLGKVDINTLKIKVAASIVAISSIHLLQAFMSIESISNAKLYFYIIIHMTFVVSAFIMSCIKQGSNN